MIITHKHHIIPRHAGGTDESSNLVELTIEDHAIAHKVLYGLWKREEDKIAWLTLSGQIGCEEARIRAYRIGYRNRDTSFFQTEEYKKKISESQKGNMNNRGKKGEWNQSLESNLKRSRSMMGNNFGIGNKGNPGKKPKIVCPHCKKIGAGGVMQRYHFDNCKSKQ